MRTNHIFSVKKSTEKPRLRNFSQGDFVESWVFFFMNKLPWLKFFPDDWITGTREMSAQEKAAWIDLLAFMWKSDNRGSVSGSWEGIARMLGLPWLDCEIIIMGMFRKNYLNLTDANGIITLSSRRMKREENTRESNRSRQKEFYKRKPNKNLTDKSKEDRRQKTDKDILPCSLPDDGKPTAEDLVKLWNKEAHPNLPRVRFLTDVRKRHAQARLETNPDQSFWEQVMSKVNFSPLLRGDQGGWKASFDWVLNPSNLVKILEGNYDPNKRG